MQFKLEDQISKTAVELAYIYLLGRQVESNESLISASNSGITIAEYRNQIMISEEYHNNVARDTAINFYIKNQTLDLKDFILKKIDKANNIDSPSKTDIIIMQTCDNQRYPVLLNISEKYNREYAQLWNIDYLSYRGIRKGCYSHHAMFNRIFMLHDLLITGYQGWVLYMDADAIILDKNYDIKDKLRILRANEQCFWMHNVFSEEDERFEWYHINNGVFAIDLGSVVARRVIEIWKGIYDNFYSKADFKQAKNWTDILDDQSSLVRILKLGDLKKFICLERLQDFFVYQALRSQGESISADQEILYRSNTLEKKGKQVYG